MYVFLKICIYINKYLCIYRYILLESGELFKTGLSFFFAVMNVIIFIYIGNDDNAYSNNKKTLYHIYNHNGNIYIS